MRKRDDDLTDDPWLTLAEIAEELRVNPATVRLWISRGRLTAMRAGQRKLLVRRSELDRMLIARDPAKQTAQPRLPVSQPLRPVFSRSLLGQVARARKDLDPKVISEAIERMQEAEAVFTQAVQSSNNAPPDPGFADRIRVVARACHQRSEALMEASWIPGFTWTPIPDPDPPVASHELRPGGNRPGSAEGWERYDRAVERLTIAVQGNMLSIVANEFAEIGRALDEIADALSADSSETQA